MVSILSTNNIEDKHPFAKCHFSCNFAHFVHLASCAWVKKFITGDTPAAAAQKLREDATVTLNFTIEVYNE